MSAIIYTPLSCKDPRNHPHRIYVSCHWEDLALLESISRQLRDTLPDCVIAHLDPTATVESDHWQELEDFHLTVIPVTENWFSQGIHQQEFTRLCAANRTVLPLLYDESREADFNEKTGNLQFLRINDRDFREKLRRALQNILFDTSLLEKVRGVFPKKMFIAYCREDFDRVKELIRYIHGDEAGKRIAIWFDKYLPMGRNFEDSILAELDDSQFFAVTTTPQLVNRDNYVKHTEYPTALGKKKIIFFEMEPTDRETLYGQLPDSRQQDYVCAQPTSAFAAYIRKLIGQPEERYYEGELDEAYLLGLAYQNGLFVEFDPKYAEKKFKFSANERSNARAAHALANMYYYGIGLPRDVKKAVTWYCKEIKLSISLFLDTLRGLDMTKKELQKVLDSYSDVPQRMGRSVQMQAQRLLDMVLDMAEHIIGRCAMNARIVMEAGFWDKADKLYATGLQMLQRMQQTTQWFGMKEHLSAQLESERNHMLVALGKGDPDVCRISWENNLDAYRDTPEAVLPILVQSGHSYGAALLRAQRCEEARAVLEQALAFAQSHAEDDRPLRELEILILRDLCRSYQLQPPQDDAQRREFAQNTLRYARYQRWLLESFPFDRGDDPYLDTYAVVNCLLEGDAHRQAGQSTESYAAYASALQKLTDLEQRLGDRTALQDLPINLLCLYVQVLEKLHGCQIGRQEAFRQAADAYRRYARLEYRAEHVPLAEDYLARLRRIANL